MTLVVLLLLYSLRLSTGIDRLMRNSIFVYETNIKNNDNCPFDNIGNIVFA